MTAHTGGHAFPTSTVTTDHGMTLRDYFAAKAMQGMVSDFQGMAKSFAVTGDAFEDTAKAAYQIADAMLRQQEVQ